MEVRITLYDDVDLFYARKDVSFYGKDEKFYQKLVDYAVLLQCKDNEDKKEVR